MGKDGSTYLEMFGINERKFLDVFENYGKTSGPTVPGHIEETTLSPSGKRALEDLIASGVGYGYWMCHYTGSHFTSMKSIESIWKMLLLS